jgi:hypothetical protein
LLIPALAGVRARLALPEVGVRNYDERRDTHLSCLCKVNEGAAKTKRKVLLVIRERAILHGVEDFIVWKGVQPKIQEHAK